MKRWNLLTILMLLVTIQCSVTRQNRSDDRFTNLYFQVAVGNTERVRQMIREGYDIDRPENTFERLTPLMIAAKEGHADIVELLLVNRADSSAKTHNGHTALMMAAYNRYPKVVKLLLDYGADPNSKSSAGHTALSEITQSDKEEIILLLTEKGAK